MTQALFATTLRLTLGKMSEGDINDSGKGGDKDHGKSSPSSIFSPNGDSRRGKPLPGYPLMRHRVPLPRARALGALRTRRFDADRRSAGSVARRAVESAGSDVISTPGIPHNFQAEQVLLGSVLVNNGAYHRVYEFLRPEHFTDPLHGRLFDSVSRLIERGQVVSPVNLRTYAEHDEDLRKSEGRAISTSSSPRRYTCSMPSRSDGWSTISTCGGS